MAVQVSLMARACCSVSWMRVRMNFWGMVFWEASGVENERGGYLSNVSFSFQFLMYFEHWRAEKVQR